MACSQNDPQTKSNLERTDNNQVDSEHTKLSAVSKMEKDTSEKDKQVKSEKQVRKVRFVEPTVVDDDYDHEQLIFSPDEMGYDNVGTVESISQQEPPQDDILQYAEEMPEFQGGTQALMDYLKANVKYPVSAKELGIQGTVYIGFVVFKDGTLGNIKIRRGVSYDLDNEAKRVIKTMPNWKPGKNNGKIVNCEMTLPIKFRLEE